MKVKNLGIVYPSIKPFIFESRKMVLKNTYGGFSTRVFYKSFDAYYQYMTNVPNSSNGNKPVDFLNRVKNRQRTSYIVSGNLFCEIPVTEFDELYSKVEKLIDLDGYLTDEKLGQIHEIYYQNPFSELTVQKMILLDYLMRIGLTDDAESRFLLEYYKHSEALEQSRQARLNSAILIPEVEKQMTKSKVAIFDK